MADEYEKKYMAADGALALSRMRMGPLLFAVMALAALAVVGTAAATKAWVLLAMLPVYALVTLLLSHLRVTVTPTHVNVQYGLFGPKVPIEKIRSAKAAPYDWKRFGGWGVRYGRNGARAYSVTGGLGQGLELEVARDDGSTYTLFVSSDTPEALVQAIAQAQQRAGGSVAASGVRVDAALASVATSDDERPSQEDYKIVSMSDAANARRM